MSEKKGSFIVFEGIDGSGKTTQINLLKQKIEALNIKCLETREPSDGPIGVMIRQCLTGRMQMDEAALAALFAADRLDHINNGTNGLKNLFAARTVKMKNIIAKNMPTVLYCRLRYAIAPLRILTLMLFIISVPSLFRFTE